LFYYGPPSPQIQETEAKELRQEGRGGGGRKRKTAATTAAQIVNFKHQQV